MRAGRGDNNVDDNGNVVCNWDDFTEQAAEVLRLLRKVRPAVRRRAGHGAVRVVGLHIRTWCCARRCAVCAVMRREKEKSFAILYISKEYF